MLTVYKSNQLDLLLEKTHQIIQNKPLTDVLQKEIFIHDNEVLFQYLNIFIAEKIGISANCKLYHPNIFIWKLFKIIYSKKKIKNIFTKSIMTWKIMKVLDKNNFFQFFNKKNCIVEKFKFSFLMSNIFEQYLLYRPDWINAWERKNNAKIIDKNEEWQINIWKEIVRLTKKNNQLHLHFSNLFVNFQKLKNIKKIINTHFPNRCFIFSSFSLNPSYIKIFKKISQHIDIYFLYITPCKNNIFNYSITQNYQSSINKEIHKKNILKSSLMELWGQYERIYSLNIINSKSIKIINCFKKNEKKNLLNNIKNNIFNFNILKKNKKKILYLSDNSISVNVCYSKKHEIEILYEKILNLLEENTTDIYYPNDIVVTSFAIDTYTSFIKSIFESKNKKKQIPFFISKKYSKKTETTLSVFKKILNLSINRFSNEEILDLLDIPEIAKNFDISEEEINILYHWVEEVKIRWAVDKKHQYNLLLPENDQNTWLYGIKKLFLSFSMNDTNSIWNNILSCTSIDNSRAKLIGKLSEFINILNKWRKKLSKPQYLTYWYSVSHLLINDFFYKSTKIKTSLKKIQNKWTNMINDSFLSDYNKKISINILKKNFIYVTNYINYQKFSPGKINFCHPSSICYIPFKIICIIGMDHQNYLKKNILDDFNLLKKHPLVGDVNIYDQNSYLFLQMISCAKESLYISYVGFSIKNNAKKYPSVLIDQLFNYIAYNFYFIGDENLNIKDNIKKIVKHFYKKHKQVSFYKEIDINNVKVNNAQKILKKQNITKYKKSSLQSSCSKKIRLEDLIKFWKNPICYFLNFKFNIKFQKKKQANITTESFLINSLDRFKINTALLKNIIHNQDIQILFKKYTLSGVLPYNFFGIIFLNKQIKEMKSIAKLITQYRDLSKKKKFNLTIKKYQIHGILHEIQNTGLLRWKASAINYSDQMSLWLEHLIYSALGGNGESKIIGYKKSILSFSSLSSDIACNYLLKYIQGYIYGIKKPLFLTQSGACWIDKMYNTKNHSFKNDKNSKTKGYKIFLKKWIGNDFYQGEKEDFYIKQIIEELNKKHIRKMYATSKKWLLPILNNKKI